MKLSAETQRALRLYGKVAAILGLGGTCAGVGIAFRLIAKEGASNAAVIGLSLSASVRVTLLLAALALAGCVLYERVRSRRAA
jgi:hypothetical protein